MNAENWKPIHSLIQASWLAGDEFSERLRAHGIDRWSTIARNWPQDVKDAYAAMRAACDAEHAEWVRMQAESKGA